VGSTTFGPVDRGQRQPLALVSDARTREARRITRITERAVTRCA
jgi:hypothetical protein